MADPLAAKALGWHVGQYIHMYFYTDAQTERPDFGRKTHYPDGQRGDAPRRYDRAER